LVVKGEILPHKRIAKMFHVKHFRLNFADEKFHLHRVGVKYFNLAPSAVSLHRLSSRGFVSHSAANRPSGESCD
jgi:hypothetical protein